MDAIATNDNLPKTKREAITLGSEFYFTGKECSRGHISHRRTTNGACIECEREKGRERYAKITQAQRDAHNARSRQRYNENIESERIRLRELKRKQRAENPGRDKELRDARKISNPNESRDRMRRWRENNPEKSRATGRESQRKRRLNPKWRLSHSISTGIRQSIARGAKGGRKWESLVGYTIDDLTGHIEKQFKPGMSWKNYGEWEIDHKIPLAAFNFHTPDDIDFNKAWSLSNLQPLWMADNRRKNSRLDKPFQPSLALAVPDNDNNKEAA